MKKKLDAVFLSLVLALCSGVFLQSCGDGGGAILVEIADLFSAASLKAAGASTCEGDCDLDLKDGIKKEFEVTFGGDPSTTLTITITAGESQSFIFNTGEGGLTGDQVEQGLLTLINDAATGSPFAVASAGAAGLIVHAFDSTVTDISHVTGAEGPLATPAETTNSTNMDFNTFWEYLYDTIVRPSDQALVDEAVDEGRISETSDADREVTIATSQEVPCDNTGVDGMIVVNTVTRVAIDGDETVDEDLPATRIDEVSFVDCELTGNLEGGGAPSNLSLYLLGSYTLAFERTVEGLVTTETATITTPESDPIAVSTDSDTTAGGVTPFWTDQVSLDMTWIWEDDDGDVTYTSNGGVCFGSAVDLGGGGTDDPEIDDDDRCTDFRTDRFVETDFLFGP